MSLKISKIRKKVGDGLLAGFFSNVCPILRHNIFFFRPRKRRVTQSIKTKTTKKKTEFLTSFAIFTLFKANILKKKLNFVKYIQFFIIEPQTRNNGIAALLNIDDEWTPTTYSTVPTRCTWQWTIRVHATLLNFLKFFYAVFYIQSYSSSK